MTARKATTLETRLQRYLEKHLPAYMVPSPLVLLETLPRTPGGKVDRKTLVALLAAQVTRSAEEVELRTSTETQLAAIWERVLHSGPITRSDDFFNLGGHSLQATQVVARIREEFGVEIPVRAMYDTPVVAALAEQIDRRRHDTLVTTAIQPVPRDGMLPLSFAQQRLWFLDQLEPNSPLYNIPGAISLRGHLDVAALARSINALISRHEPLRTTFATVDGQPVQRIASALTLPLPVIDLSGISKDDEKMAAVDQIMEHEAQRPFDLARGPLVHIWLLRLGSDEHLLLLTLHHSVADGWSSGIVFRELNAFYTAFLAGTTPDLPPLPIQYADYAVWQRDWLQGENLDKQLSYWRKQL
ncbi:MAG TPA: condensation domain-containing protein, partial [Ktedonobacterales bacterium]|nr:condensation domain-containing protein [Ktedonobacterales bacterium]